MGGINVGKVEDFTGKKIGLLQVLSLEKERKNGYAVWKCLCDCGNVCYKKSSYLKRHPSCGCLGKKSMIEKNKKHGMVYSKEYNSWQSAKQRCTNINSKDYKNYGGKGIKMCNEWLDSFEQFFKDMGEKPKGYSLDRIDRDGNYEPSNCRWADIFTQNHNRRSRNEKDNTGYRNIRKMEHGYVIKITHEHSIRTSLTIKNLGDAIKIRDRWECEYRTDPEKWVFDTNNKQYKRR